MNLTKVEGASTHSTAIEGTFTAEMLLGKLSTVPDGVFAWSSQ